MDGNNEEINNNLSEYDFAHTNTGYGCGTMCDTNVYSKIIK